MKNYRNQYINPPTGSKINGISLLMMVMGVITIWEVLPPELNDKLEATVMMVGPALIMVFRSFFTGHKKRENNEDVSAFEDFPCECDNNGDEQQMVSSDGSCANCGGYIQSVRPQERAATDR